METPPLAADEPVAATVEISRPIVRPSRKKPQIFLHSVGLLTACALVYWSFPSLKWLFLEAVLPYAQPIGTALLAIVVLRFKDWRSYQTHKVRITILALVIFFAGLTIYNQAHEKRDKKHNAETIAALRKEIKELQDETSLTLSVAKSTERFASGGETFPLVTHAWNLTTHSLLFQLYLVENAVLTEATAQRADEGAQPDWVLGRGNTLHTVSVSLSEPLSHNPYSNSSWLSWSRQWPSVGIFSSDVALYGATGSREVVLPDSERIIVLVNSSADNGQWEEVLAFRKLGLNQWATRTIIGGYFKTTGKSGVLADRASRDYPAAERHIQMYPFPENLKNFFLDKPN